MKRFSSLAFSLFCTAFSAIYAAPEAKFAATEIDSTTQQLQVTIPLTQDEYIYADTITFSVDKPGTTLSKWNSSIQPASRYDQQFRASKNVIAGNPVLTLTIHKASEAPIADASLRLVYQTNKGKTAIESFFPLSFWAPEHKKAPEQVQQEAAITQSEVQPDIATAPTPEEGTTQAAATPSHPVTPEAGKATSPGWTSSLTSVIEHSKSLWIQLLFAILLGLLMSLTPCIYPMIPITMGILQAHGSCSVLRNFLLALAYTVGIATTFACLGLAAALAGHLMGEFLTHPVVIAFIIALLLYVAFSLFGFYELYIPRSLSNRQAGTCSTGGFFTAFLFGAVSGTIASPCLSPGIIFMLTLVAALKNVIFGFALLFAFGIGLSLPLLLIGTFSTSLALLPRAGSWMEEIKYIFGFMMLGMCCYFLSSLIPGYALLAILALLCFIAGIFYLIHAKAFAETARRIYCLLGMFLIAASVIIAANSIKSYLVPCSTACAIDWQRDYTTALNKAKQEQKKLLVFVHAPLCLACDELERTLNSNSRFISAIKGWVATSIDLKNSSAETTRFREQFKIVGAPNVILIDPTNESVIMRWDYELSSEQIEQLLTIIETA